MVNFLCETNHLLIIIGVLLAALIVLGSGKGIGTLLGPLIKKLTGKGDGVTVNIGELPNGFVERRRYPPITIDDLKKVLEATSKNRCDAHETIKTRQDGVLKDTGSLLQDCRDIWLEIKAINLRQLQLREKLPEQYVNKSELGVMNDRLKSIDSKLDRYFERGVK